MSFANQRLCRAGDLRMAPLASEASRVGKRNIVRYQCWLTDFDGTLAHDGHVDDENAGGRGS